jgi:hypothetical protein
MPPFLEEKVPSPWRPVAFTYECFCVVKAHSTAALGSFKCICGQPLAVVYATNLYGMECFYSDAIGQTSVQSAHLS